MNTDKNFFYANGMELAVSTYDISLKFLRNGSPSNAVPGVPNAPARLDEIIVAMSPGHAKAMLAGLYKTIVDYEENIGPITIGSAEEVHFMKTFGPLIK
jgi:hypothetical protein